MMTLIGFLIYLGGAFGNKQMEIGFLNRVVWPIFLGAAIMRFILGKYSIEDLDT
jgi:hypothetical protein